MGVNSLDIVGAIVMMTIIIITIVVDVIVVHICLSVPHKFSLLSTVLVCLPGSACACLMRPCQKRLDGTQYSCACEPGTIKRFECLFVCLVISCFLQLGIHPTLAHLPRRKESDVFIFLYLQIEHN